MGPDSIESLVHLWLKHEQVADKVAVDGAEDRCLFVSSNRSNYLQIIHASQMPVRS